MTILVTGASGNTGRHVVDLLVRAVTRQPQALAPRAGVDVVEGDFQRPETWPTVLDRVEQVRLIGAALEEDVGTHPGYSVFEPSR
ncbi:hypothetical protein GCM10027290_51560 [Micromonospora sonneratiae]|uniref:NAD(P)H-binding n=1 Tax=Micromonospora sonneratiae TaxID=1184706 RepID=A0ABW3YBC3_9ACTN